MEQKESENPASAGEKSKKPLGKILAIIFGVIALILIGGLVWLWTSSQNTQKDLEDKNKKLQAQINELKKKTADADKTHGESEEMTDSCPDATDAFRETIADAVSSKNYAALEDSMTDPVTVVYAATEFGGPRTPAEAVGDMAYLNDATAPWDFDLPDAIVDGYRAGFYEQYFPEGAYVGKSSDGRVISFTFECGEINQIFIAAHENVL